MKPPESASDGETTVSSPYINSLIKLAATANLDAYDILRQAGIDPTRLSDPDARFPFDFFLHAWHIAADRLQDPCLGLHAAKLFHPSTYGPLACVLLTCPTLGEATRQLLRFQHLLETGALVELGHDQEACYLELHTGRFDDEFIRPVVECTLTEPLYIARFLTNAEYHDLIHPLRVTFRYQPAQAIASYEAQLNAPVTFGQPHNRLYFSPALLQLPTSFSDPSLYQSVLKQLDARHLATEGGLTQQVRQIVIEHLPSGVPTIQAVADACHLSYRTLQRRLADEGWHYHTLVEHLRQQLAEDLLAENQVSIKEIAFLLGFSDSSAFQKAFKRWRQCSPGDYRRQHRPPPPG